MQNDTMYILLTLILYSRILIFLINIESKLTINSRRSLSSSWAEGGAGCTLPRLSSSNCRVSSSTLATATDNSFSFSLNNARIDSRSLAAKRKSKVRTFHYSMLILQLIVSFAFKCDSLSGRTLNHASTYNN